MTEHSSTANSDLLALAETIHRARFPFDRTPTPFETQDASGREYCLRIARSIMAEHGIRAQRQPDAREATLKMVAGLFEESVHETYTREEVVSIVEDMIRLGSSFPSTSCGSPTTESSR